MTYTNDSVDIVAFREKISCGVILDKSRFFSALWELSSTNFFELCDLCDADRPYEAEAARDNLYTFYLVHHQSFLEEVDRFLNSTSRRSYQIWRGAL